MMNWTAPIMIVSYVFLLLFFVCSYDVMNTLHNIERLLDAISSDLMCVTCAAAPRMKPSRVRTKGREAVSADAWAVMLNLNGVPVEVAKSLALKLCSAPSYGLPEALREYPWLANDEYEKARSLIHEYSEQKGGG